MRFLFFLFIGTIAISSLAQRRIMIGSLTDVKSEPIVGAHIRNQTAGKITVSSPDGKFQIPALAGDTLLITSVGFNSLLLPIQQSWIENTSTFIMQAGSIRLTELTVSSIPTIERFKEKIIETEIKDSVTFWYFGVDRPVPKTNEMLEGKHKSILFAITKPAGFLHYNLSKKEKEKRKFHKIKGNQSAKMVAESKFTREWVKAETKLEGDELTSFIAFCNFSWDYLEKTPLYVIREDMLVLLSEFQNQ